MKTRCTNRDYIQFMEHCREYVTKFRVGHWKIKYKFDQSKSPDRLAHCEYKTANLAATITLFADWSPEDIVCDKNLKDTALHEVAHLVLAELTQAATEKSSKDVIYDREHEVIRRLCIGLCHGK